MCVEGIEENCRKYYFLSFILNNCSYRQFLIYFICIEQMIFKKSIDPSYDEQEDTFFSVFHTQVPPEEYENRIQNVSQGKF